MNNLIILCSAKEYNTKIDKKRRFLKTDTPNQTDTPLAPATPLWSGRCALYQFLRLNFEQHAALGLQHVDDHLDEGLGREEYAVVLRDVLGELVEEVFIDAPDHVAADLVERVIVEDTQQLIQQRVREHSVVFGQYTVELLALRLDQLHGVVDHLAEAVHDMAGRIFDICGGYIGWQVEQKVVLRLFREKQRALGGKVARLYGQDAPAARGAAAQDLCLDELKTAVLSFATA